ncbi:MAG: sigma-70 family RNA polymerase sigma factor [Clostridia bacterium]|nr:sigma-70 family RNA polymerase sigma factor [Clostridia bacterium]
MNGESSYRRFLDGDEGAASEIIREYREGLIFFIYRYVKNESVAEDIAIDAFSDLFVKKHRYNFKVSLKTYLYMIAKSKALNYIKRSKIIVISELTGKEADETLTPESHLLQKEENLMLHSAMAELSEDMRSALHLIYFEQMSYAQAAKVMGKSEKQISNLLYRAKGKLREILGGDFIK